MDTEQTGMGITQHQLDRADLVVIVSHDGLVEWSANRSREAVADMLHRVADSIKDGTL